VWLFYIHVNTALEIPLNSRATCIVFAFFKTRLDKHETSCGVHIVCCALSQLHAATYRNVPQRAASHTVEERAYHANFYIALETNSNNCPDSRASPIVGWNWGWNTWKDVTVSISRRQRFFVDRVINVWNALPSTVNFTSLNILRNSFEQIDFSSFLVCNILVGPCCPALLKLCRCKCAYCCIIGQIKWWWWWWSPFAHAGWASSQEKKYF